MTNRILLVDDERSIRESLSKILRAENYEVVVGENAQDAIEKHGAARIDLLILDLNMPVKNAWAALERLVGINPLSPVVIITGRSNQPALAETAGGGSRIEEAVGATV